MFVLGNLIIAIANILDVVLWFYYWLILVRALISWVNPDPYNPVVRFLHAATEPVLMPFRRLLPRMQIDISPILAFLAIWFLKDFAVRTLLQLGHRLQ